MPGLTRYPGEGGPRIVQQPLSSGLRPMITMVIRPCVGIRLGSHVSAKRTIKSDTVMAKPRKTHFRAFL